MKTVRALFVNLEIKYAVIFIWILLTSAYAVRLMLNSMVADAGIKLQQLLVIIEEQRLQNQLLENKIDEQSSLKTMEQKAKQLGFKKAHIEWIYK